MDEKTVKYSQVESDDVTIFDLTKNAHRYIILSLDSTYVCKRCEKLFTIHKSEKCVTFRCRCGCRIIYPKNKDGVRLTTWITQEEYKKNEAGICERV